MNTKAELLYEPSDNALDRAIRAAIEQPPPEEIKNRVLQKAVALTVSDISYSSRSARWIGRITWTKKIWLAVAGTAAVVLAALLFFSLQPPSIAWSQVVEAARAMPWIHMKAVSRDGRSMMETWLSFPRKVAATRDRETVGYDDFRSEVRYEYNLQQKKLYRLTTRDAEQLKAAEEYFAAIMQGNVPREDEHFFGLRIVKKRQRTVNERGRRSIVYEFELKPPEGIQLPADRSTTEVEFRVSADNPGKLLPASMTITQGKEKADFSFDYPAEGPADIYALGVPRDAPLEDRTPPPELNRILKTVEANRRSFGDYLAVVSGNYLRPLRLIRCKGNKFRVDVGMGEPKSAASAADLEKWWRTHARETLPQGAVVCDGRRVYLRDVLARQDSGWKLFCPVTPGEERSRAMSIGESSQCMVDLLAYPPNLDPQNVAFSPQYTAHLDPKGENGPAGTVRVEIDRGKSDNANDRNSYHKEEYWLQPKYGYAVVKYAISGCPAVDEDPQRKQKSDVYEYDEFRQTPHGVWYPTAVRRKNASHAANKAKPGGVEYRDDVTYIDLDFTAKLPDEIFTTQWQGDVLTGIQLPPPDGKRSPHDLRKIRPPGGAPLIQFSSNGIASVEGMERAHQRLESAPLKDTDQWIAELERITGTKPDPTRWEEKQGWRTDLVARLSVAFDGLTWNAKAADRLFKRAQTMPPSEAKAWKEAFEAVLKKKIDQAYFVPLVLIPVDALFEGQHYSIERVRKYRDRLKQLTAEDVSLWQDEIDEFGGTRLDAAVNIILLDDFFDKGKFQRDKFKAAIEAGKP